MFQILLILLQALLVRAGPSSVVENDYTLSQFLKDTYEKNATSYCIASNLADWNFATDVSNKEKEQLLVSSDFIITSRNNSKRGVSKIKAKSQNVLGIKSDKNIHNYCYTEFLHTHVTHD